MSALELTLLYLLAAVLGVVVCRSFKLPPMLGYLAVGVVIGPHALALAQNADGVRHLGEFGVVFLMFVIGLEFNLPKLRSMRRHVFGLGLLQVVLTLLLVTFASVFLLRMAPTLWNMPWQTALALSGTLAMSSTAIVVKLLSERLELASEHGKRVMGVLLFQDLAVVPLLVLIPALGSPADELFMALGIAALKALVAHAGGAAQERRAVRAQFAAGHAGAELADRAGGPEPGTGRLHCRHADFRNTVQASGRNRHSALSRCAAGLVLHQRGHVAGLA